MKRIIIICEGPTEKEFCTKILFPHFLAMGYIIQSPLIKKSHGGIVKWGILKKEIENYLKSEANVFVTTLIDYYGLYAKYQFPNWDKSFKIVDKNKRMDLLELSMEKDIPVGLQTRFFPYLQLHEFEGLLFNEIDIFYQQIPKYELVGKKELEATFKDYANPEMINDKRETSPSHRLERIILGYNKVVYGNILAEAIGLKKMRIKSPRFNNWIGKLEKL